MFIKDGRRSWIKSRLLVAKIHLNVIKDNDNKDDVFSSLTMKRMRYCVEGLHNEFLLSKVPIYEARHEPQLKRRSNEEQINISSSPYLHSTGTHSGDAYVDFGI